MSERENNCGKYLKTVTTLFRPEIIGLVIMAIY